MPFFEALKIEGDLGPALDDSAAAFRITQTLG